MAERLPPLNALRSFDVAAKHLSFTKAAGELNVTHSALEAVAHGLQIGLADIGQHQAAVDPASRALPPSIPSASTSPTWSFRRRSTAWGSL